MTHPSLSLYLTLPGLRSCTRMRSFSLLSLTIKLSCSAAKGRKQFNNTTYNPQLLITGTISRLLGRRLSSCDPALSCYREEPPVNSYNLPDNGEIGFGWREPEINNGNVFRWSVSTRTSVNVNLFTDSDLVLKFRMLNWLDRGVVNTLKLSINGQNIPLTYEEMAQGGPLYSAIIPRTVLTGFPSHTQLIFTIDKLTPVPNASNLLLGSSNGINNTTCSAIAFVDCKLIGEDFSVFLAVYIRFTVTLILRLEIFQSLDFVVV